MVRLIIFSFVLLISCEYSSSGENELLDYSKPKSLINYTKFEMHGKSFFEGAQSETPEDTFAYSPNFSNKTLEYMISGYSTESPDQTVHFFHKVIISNTNFFNFQGLDSIQYNVDISVSSTASIYSNLEPVYNRLFILREGDIEYSYVSNPSDYLNNLRNSSFNYKLRWEFGLVSGSNNNKQNPDNSYIYMVPNVATYKIKIELTSLIF